MCGLSIKVETCRGESSGVVDRKRSSTWSIAFAEAGPFSSGSYITSTVLNKSRALIGCSGASNDTLLAVPLFLDGDLRAKADFLGDLEPELTLLGDVGFGLTLNGFGGSIRSGSGPGVGGSSANSWSTAILRFSSSSLARSA